jgi:hypothetical protein
MSNQVVTFDSEKLLEEYRFAQSEYKKAVGDQLRDYWDGYLSAFEKFLDETDIDYLSL